jgi:hypothetical protein
MCFLRSILAQVGRNTELTQSRSERASVRWSLSASLTEFESDSFMGKSRARTSRGKGKNKNKKHARTVWAGVDREVRRQELDETARVCGTTAAVVAIAQKAEAARAKATADKQTAETGTTNHGESATASSSSASTKKQ